MKKTLLSLIVTGSLVSGFNVISKADDSPGIIAEKRDEIIALKYINEPTVRKIELPTILSHLENEWYGFLNNQSKNEKHLELEKKFYEDIEKIEGNEFERVKKIYEYIVDVIPDYGLPKGVSHGQATLGQLIESGTGVCTDKSNALYDALRFSGIKSDIINGVVDRSLLHQWVRAYINLDGKEICLDLDPTWYKKFTPIKPTIEFSEIIINGDNPLTLHTEEYLKYYERKTDKEIGEIIGKYSLSDYLLSSDFFIKKN